MKILVACLLFTVAYASQKDLNKSDSPADDACAKIPFGQDHYLPHNSNCSLFYQCYKGKPYLHQCPPGLHFDTQNNVCNWPASAGCQLDGSPTTSYPITTEVHVNEDITCPPGHVVSYFPHPSQCDQFYQCTNGRPVLHFCPEGLHYDSKLQVCNYPSQVNCSVSVTEKPSTTNHITDYPLSSTQENTEQSSTSSLETEQPTSTFPQETEQPTSAFPQETEQPTSTFPQETEQPTSTSPQETEQPTSTFPQETEQPTTTSPQEIEQSTSTSPQETELPTTTSPQETEQLTSTSPQETKQPTSTSPQETEQPTSTSPQETEQPTSTSPQETEQTTSTSPQETEQPITTSPQETEQPITTSPQETEQPTSTSPQETDQPITTSLQETEQPTSTSPQETEQPTTTSQQETEQPTTTSQQETEQPTTTSQQGKEISTTTEIANVTSEESLERPCEEGSTGLLLPDKTDCSKFFQCVHGNPIQMSCPEGLFYDPTLHYCNYHWEVDCHVEESDEGSGESEVTLPETTTAAHDSCVDIPFNQQHYFPHPSNCSLFYQCSNGKPYLQECPSGLHFDTSLNVCNWPASANCISTRGLPNVVFAAADEGNNSLISHKCPEIDGKDPVYFPDPQNCRNFYRCENQYAHLHHCPKGLYFESKLNICKKAQDFHCENNSSN